MLEAAEVCTGPSNKHENTRICNIVKTVQEDTIKRHTRWVLFLHYCNTEQREGLIPKGHRCGKECSVLEHTDLPPCILMG